MGLFLFGFYNKKTNKTMNNNELQLMSCKAGYTVAYNDRSNCEMSEKQLENLSKNWGKVDYKGELSKQTSRKIAHLLQVWQRTLYINSLKSNSLQSQKVRNLVFITLTLSSKQVHDDNFIKRNLLNNFIIYMGRKFDMKNYLWKAEKQKNGSIHFHIVTDVYIKKN